MADTYANAQWSDAGQTSLAVDWTTQVDGSPLTQRIAINAIRGLGHYDAVLAQGLSIAAAPILGSANYKAMIRRRADAQTRSGDQLGALLILKAIGE